MHKLFKRTEDGTLVHRQVWAHGDTLHINEGTVGSQGQHRTIPAVDDPPPASSTLAEMMDDYVAAARAEGYREVPEDDQGWVVLQLGLTSALAKNPADASLLERGQAELDEVLGWRGVGHCDGFDVGPPVAGGGEPVVNFFCVVIDLDQGVLAARDVAQKLGRADDHTVGTRAPGEDSEYLLAWPRPETPQPFDL